MRKILITIFFIQSVCFSQQIQQQWMALYNSGHGINDGLSIAHDKSGNVYVTDNSYTGVFQPYTYKLIKYNNLGSQKWVQQYGRNGGLLASSFIFIDDSDYIYISCTSDYGTYEYFEAYKYDTSGNLLWNQLYTGPVGDTDLTTAATIDKYSNFYVTGESAGSGTLLDYCTIKYNSAGTQQWVARFDQNHCVDKPHAIAVDDYGNVYVTGESEAARYKSVIITIKYNSSGEQQWVRTYKGTPNPYNYSNVGEAICKGIRNDIYVTGYITPSNLSQNCITLKYSSYGELLWARNYGYYEGKKIAIDDTDNVYVGGKTYLSPSMAFAILSIKYDSVGTLKWIKIYGDSLTEVGFGCEVSDMKIDNRGNVYMGGVDYISNQPNPFSKGLIIKYNSQGNLVWDEKFDYGQHLWNGFRMLSIDTSGNIYAVGDVFDSTWGHLCSTIKYSQLVGMKRFETHVTKSYRLLQNYPNPFNPVTTIKYDIPKDSKVTIKVYDLLGKEVTTLVNENKQPGYYEAKFNGNNLASGLYFYRIEAGDFVNVKKMVLVK